MTSRGHFTTDQSKVSNIGISYIPNYISNLEEQQILQNVRGTQVSWKEVRPHVHSNCTHRNFERFACRMAQKTEVLVNAGQEQESAELWWLCREGNIASRPPAQMAASRDRSTQQRYSHFWGGRAKPRSFEPL